MRRNSGIIGPKQSVNAETAIGIHDTFDQYNNSESWPKGLVYIGLSVNSGTIYENSTNSTTLSTSNLTVDTVLYWTILHGTTTSADFGNSVTSGSFVQIASSQQGTIAYNTNFIGNTSKTARTYQIQIRTNSTIGTIVYTSGVYTIPPITIASLYWSSSTTINEGGSSSLYFQAGNCGTWSGWTIVNSYSGTASGSDFSGGLPTSSIRNPGTLSAVTYSATNDLTTEGTETLTVQLSYAGFNIGPPQTLTINDTSQSIIGTITPSTTNVTEGNDVVFTISASGSFTGTLYYTINNVTGTMSTGDFTDGLLSGSFSVISGSGSFTKTLVADGITEGEQFSVSLRSGSTSGTILATTTTITVTDAAAPVSNFSNPIIAFTTFNSTTSAGIVNNYYRRYIVGFSYTQAEMQAVLGSSDVTLYGLRFFVSSQPTNQPYPSYAIGLKNGAFISTVNAGTTGYTIVSAPKSQAFLASSYKEITFDTPFVWSASGGLAITAAWGQVPVNWSSTGTTRIGAGNLFYARTDSTGAYVINVDAFSSSLGNGRPVLEFKLTA